jgi:hypothetical protein
MACRQFTDKQRSIHRWPKTDPDDVSDFMLHAEQMIDAIGAVAASPQPQ